MSTRDRRSRFRFTLAVQRSEVEPTRQRRLAPSTEAERVGTVEVECRFLYDRIDGSRGGPGMHEERITRLQELVQRIGDYL